MKTVRLRSGGFGFYRSSRLHRRTSTGEVQPMIAPHDPVRERCLATKLDQLGHRLPAAAPV